MIRAGRFLRRGPQGLRLLTLLLPGLVAASLAAAQTPPGGAPRPAAPEPAPPGDPALAPPAPARLDRAAPAAPAPRPMAFPAPLPGLETLPTGGWRLRLAPGAEGLGPAATATIADLGRRLAAAAAARPDQPGGRVTVLTQVTGPTTDVSAARRRSLARALAVKEALVAGGLAATRIDLRPLGRTEEALDVADVLPPGAAQQRAEAPPPGAGGAGMVGR